MSEQAVSVKPSATNHVKKLSRTSSLKEAAREAAKAGDELAKNWLHNKSVNGKRKPRDPSLPPPKPQPQAPVRGRRKR